MHLTRLFELEDCTIGVLRVAGPICVFTLEPAWQDNEQGHSCIPEGVYEVRRLEHEKHGRCFEIEGVPDRSSILLHVGNFRSQTRGCILPGTRVGRLGESLAVLHSKVAMGELWTAELEDFITVHRAVNFTRGIKCH